MLRKMRKCLLVFLFLKSTNGLNLEKLGRKIFPFNISNYIARQTAGLLDELLEAVMHLVPLIPATYFQVHYRSLFFASWLSQTPAGRVFSHTRNPPDNNL